MYGLDPSTARKFGYGVDGLLCAYYEKVAIQAHTVGAPFGMFINTGKPGQSTWKNFTTSRRASAIRTQSAPFDRSHAYKITPQLLKQVYADAKLAQQLAISNPSTTQFFSPFCEHNHPRRVMEPIFKELGRIAPNVYLVNSIWKGEEVPGTITEIHLENTKKAMSIRIPKNPFIVSFDGFGGDGSGDFPDADIPRIMARFAQAIMILGWNFRCNVKWGHADTTPINLRKALPDVPYLRGMYEAGKGREGAITWKGDDLYKPYADDHGKGDWKDNNAMCILSKVNLESVVVKDSRGNTIDVMTRFQPNHPRGSRYYSRRASVELGDLAQRKTGSRLIQIHNQPLTDADLRSHDFA